MHKLPGSADVFSENFQSVLGVRIKWENRSFQVSEWEQRVIGTRDSAAIALDESARDRNEDGPTIHARFEDQERCTARVDADAFASAAPT